MLTLYAVTDRQWTGIRTLYDQVECALKGGVTLVQLREKNMAYEQFLEEAVQIKGLCRRYGVPLIINDNAGIAIKAGADGVHVGLDDMPIEEIRKSTGNNFIIGATAKTVEQGPCSRKCRCRLSGGRGRVSLSHKEKRGTHHA